MALEIAVPDGELNGNVQTDARVIEGLAGSITPAPAAVRAAACHNVENWLDDHTLDTNTVVSSNATLLRVAEVVGGGEVDAELARLAEIQRWRRSTTLTLDIDMKNAGFDQADLNRYIQLTSEPPSAVARDRYVAYAASRHMDIFFVMYAKVDELSTGRTSDGAFPTVNTWIAGEDRLADVSFPETDCEH